MMKKRKHKPNLSLKRLREIIDLTQGDFAAMVGVSLPLVKAVECGQQPLAEKLARKISIATGAQLIRWNFKGKAKRVPVPEGKIYWMPVSEKMVDEMRASKRRLSQTDYGREHFDYHRRFFRTDPKAAELALKEAQPALRALFRAASTDTSTRPLLGLPALTASLWNWIREANQTFRLGAKLSPSAQPSRPRRPRASR